MDVLASGLDAANDDGSLKVAEQGPAYLDEEAAAIQDLTPAQLMRKIKQLEKEMHKAAKALEFEEAANLRDKVGQLRKRGLGISHIKSVG